MEEYCNCPVPDFADYLSRFPDALPPGVHRIHPDRAAICDTDGCDLLIPRRGQTRKQSMLEVTVNYSVGFVVAWITSALVLKAFGFQASVADNFWITVIFTAVSMARSYVVRRIFNHFS
jgi:hypothetical protein